jgi:hypothetical protein
MNDLYIYYQVRDEDAAALAPRVRAMQQRLALHHGVAGQLKRRPETEDGLQTWMEIYPATRAGFDAALAAAVADAALAQLTVGKRHTEIFTDLSTCA